MVSLATRSPSRSTARIPAAAASNPSPAPALVAMGHRPSRRVASPVPTEFTLSVTVTCEECGYPLNLPCVTKDDIVAIMATLSDKFGTGVAQLEEGYTVIAATAPTEASSSRSGPSPPPSPPPPSPPPPAPPSPPPAIPPLDARMQTWANNLTGGTRGATSWVLVALMVIALFTVLCCLYLAVRWFRRRRQEKYPSAKAAQGGVATNRLGGRLQLRQATPNVKRSQSGNARSPSVSRDGSQGSHGSHGSVDVHRTSMDAYIGGACSTSGAPSPATSRCVSTKFRRRSTTCARRSARLGVGRRPPQRPPSSGGCSTRLAAQLPVAAGRRRAVREPPGLGLRLGRLGEPGRPRERDRAVRRARGPRLPERARVPAQPGRRQLEPPPVGPAAGHRRSRRQLHRGEPGRAAAAVRLRRLRGRVGGAEAAGVSHLP